MTPLLLSVATLPLIFNPFGLSSYVLPKLVWLSVGVAGEALFFWRKKIEIHVGILSLLFLFYSALLLLASLLAQDPLLAFKGSYDRFEGMATLLLYFLLLVAAENQKLQRKGVQLLLAGALLTLFLGFLQRGHLFSLTSDRTFSTLGQPNFFAAYLTLLFPFSFLLPSLWGLGVAAFLGLGILLSASRAALFAVLLLIPFHFLREKSKRVKQGILFLFFLFLLSPFFLPTLSQRITSLYRGKDRTAKSRVLIYKTALKVLSEKPLWGVGPENFSLAFFPKKPKALNALEGSESFADRAHDIFLDEGLKGGVLGLFAFLFFFSFALRKLWSSNDALSRAVVSSVVGYFLVHLPSFPTVVPEATLLYLLGTSCGRSSLSFPRPAFLFLALSPLFFFGLYLPADLLAKEGSQTLTSNPVRFSIPALTRASELVPFESKYWTLLGQAYLFDFQKGGDSQSLLQAKRAFQKALFYAPRDPFVLAHLALTFSKEESPSAFRQAEKLFQEATARFPANANFYREWGIAEAKRGRLARAVFLLQRARALSPKDPETLASLGLAYQKEGKQNRAVFYFQESLHIAESSKVYGDLALSYFYLRKWLKAKRAVLQAIALDPENGAAYNNLGAIYMKLGERERAKKSFREALRLAKEESVRGVARRNLQGLHRP